MSKKPNKAPSAAALAKAAAQADATAVPVEAIAVPVDPVPVVADPVVDPEPVTAEALASQPFDDSPAGIADDRVLVKELINESVVFEQSLSPDGVVVSSLTPVAQDNQPPAAPFVELTVENCTHFQNSKGRIFEATDVLRQMARRQNLKPIPAPK